MYNDRLFQKPFNVHNQNTEDNANLGLSSRFSPLTSPVDDASQQQHYQYSNDDKGETVINVSPTIKRKRMHSISVSVDSNPVVNEPSSVNQVSYIESQQKATTREGAQEMYGYHASNDSVWVKKIGGKERDSAFSSAANSPRSSLQERELSSYKHNRFSVASDSGMSTDDDTLDIPRNYDS